MNNEYLKVGDKTYRSAKVIMLPTKDKSNLYKILKPLHDEDIKSIVGNIVYNKNNSPSGTNEYFAPQHLYIISSEEIKEGDYITDNYKVWQWKDDSSLLGRRKVIASTDPSFTIEGVISIYQRKGLTNHYLTSKPFPRPSSDFIKKYCELNGIEDVLIEYEERKVEGMSPNLEGAYQMFLKVAPDNTISIIKKPEDKLYTKEELVDFINLAWASCSATTYEEGDDIGADCASWIEIHIK